MFSSVFKMFCLLCFGNCTFGSIGDNNKEKLVILQNLLTLTAGIRTNLQTQVVLYDDQADDTLNQFNLISGGITYSVNIQSSVLKIDSGTYRINPTNRLFGSEKTHTPYTIPLDLPTTDPYGKSYSYVGSSSLNSFFSVNAQTDTGSAYSIPGLVGISDAPQGVVSLVSMSISEWYLDLQVTDVTNTPGVPKQVQIYLKPGTKTVSPKCKIPVDGARKLPIPIALQYSNLFKDRITTGVTYSLLTTLFTTPYASSSTVVVAEFSAADLYKILNDNVSTEDLVFFVPGCFPNVELR